MVYIDLLVIMDLFMNYIILLTTGLLLSRITKFKKIFLSSVIGTIPLIVLFIDMNKFIIVLISLLFSIIMSIIAYNYKDIVYTIKNVIYMYLSSIFLAGSLYFINTSILPKINSYIFNTIMLITLSPLITYIYLKSISNLKINYSNYYKIDIYLKDKPKITINTFLDTGNLLKDPYSHKSIVLVNRKKIKLTGENIILVPYQTIDNKALLKCFSPEKIYINNIGYRKKVLIGLIDELNIEGADGIINKKILERI